MNKAHDRLHYGLISVCSILFGVDLFWLLLLSTGDMSTYVFSSTTLEGGSDEPKPF